jgi:gamma-glutamyltranspeptidase/glutathione hydrolase
VHVSAIDKAGNMAAATPSGAWIRSNEVVAELGFPLGTRLMTFHLSPGRHPNVIAPFKRPRTTISPTLVTREGEPWLAFGSMGGDQQDQWQLQFFLNRALFGMDLPAAIEAPKFSTEHFPASFGASERHPRRLRIEPMKSEVFEALRAKGHELDIAAPWSEGFLLAIEAHRGSGLLEAGCDPRGSKTRIFAPATRVY